VTRFRERDVPHPATIRLMRTSFLLVLGAGALTLMACGSSTDTTTTDAGTDSAADSAPTTDASTHDPSPDASAHVDASSSDASTDAHVDGSALRCAPYDPQNPPQSDPTTVCMVRCTSPIASPDVSVLVVPTAPHASTFVATVHQTAPTMVNLTFTSTVANWSGHFFNFDDMTSQLPEKFHVLVSGAGGPSNVEVYTTDLSTGIVHSQQLDCQASHY
jgi:hypothetical protein